MTEVTERTGQEEHLKPKTAIIYSPTYRCLAHGELLHLHTGSAHCRNRSTSCRTDQLQKLIFLEFYEARVHQSSQNLATCPFQTRPFHRISSGSVLILSYLKALLPAHIASTLDTRITFGEGYKSRRSSLWNFLQSPVNIHHFRILKHSGRTGLFFSLILRPRGPTGKIKVLYTSVFTFLHSKRNDRLWPECWHACL